MTRGREWAKLFSGRRNKLRCLPESAQEDLTVGD